MLSTGEKVSLGLVLGALLIIALVMVFVSCRGGVGRRGPQARASNGLSLAKTESAAESRMAEIESLPWRPWGEKERLMVR